MRPPQITGGNPLADSTAYGLVGTSMRPPQITGGNLRGELLHRGAPGTSMRPPQITGGTLTLTELRSVSATPLQ